MVQLRATVFIVVDPPAVIEEAGVLPRHAHGDGLAGDGALQQGLVVGAEDAVGFDGWGCGGGCGCGSVSRRRVACGGALFFLFYFH